MVRTKKRMLLGMLLGLMVAGLASSWAAEEDSGKKARQFTGTVQEVTSGSIEVAKKKESQTFSLTEATRYRDADGKTIERADLKVESKVTVRYREADNGSLNAISIQLK
ncbi:MAG: hypothetical protein HY538_01745 [Deltaproteobacteria bacterium]|nr:hypothetical protein [Deltaproteobacteria bacterium]